MTSATAPSGSMSGSNSAFRVAPRRALVVAVLLALALLAGWRIAAQVEGERGIAPLANTGDFEVGGIKVNTTGKTPAEAREILQLKGGDKVAF